MTLNTLWTRIDPTVQQWLLANPGCLMLPRTLVNRVEAATGTSVETDGHGEHILSEEDLDFLKDRRRESMAGHGPDTPSGVRGAEHAEAVDR
jgi:hypothetical protein